MGRVGNFKRRMNFLFSNKYFPAYLGFFLAIAPIFLALLGVHKFRIFFGTSPPSHKFSNCPNVHCVVTQRSSPGAADYDTTAADDHSRRQQHF